MSPVGPDDLLDHVELPMFPLGSVLLPGMLLPLHVFEDRYRVLVERVLAGDGAFGVTLIERGSEVGGDDVRADIGCLARVLDAEQQPDGRWYLVAVGTDRIRVDEWLADDPHPRATVSTAFDAAPWGGTPDEWAATVEAFETLIELVERVSGGIVAPRVTLVDDPAVATFQMAATAPIGPLDRQRVLAADTAEARMVLLAEAFEHATVLVNDAASN